MDFVTLTLGQAEMSWKTGLKLVFKDQNTQIGFSKEGFWKRKNELWNDKKKKASENPGLPRSIYSPHNCEAEFTKLRIVHLPIWEKEPTSVKKILFHKKMANIQSSRRFFNQLLLFQKTKILRCSRFCCSWIAALSVKNSLAKRQFLQSRQTDLKAHSTLQNGRFGWLNGAP